MTLENLSQRKSKKDKQIDSLNNSHIPFIVSITSGGMYAPSLYHPQTQSIDYKALVSTGALILASSAFLGAVGEFKRLEKKKAEESDEGRKERYTRNIRIIANGAKEGFIQGLKGYALGTGFGFLTKSIYLIESPRINFP